MVLVYTLVSFTSINNNKIKISNRIFTRKSENVQPSTACVYHNIYISHCINIIHGIIIYCNNLLV